MKSTLRFFKNNLTKYEIFLFIIFIFSGLFFVWDNRFLPFQDYPDWLFQGFIFSEIIKSKFLYYNIASYPVPNSLSTYTLGFLNFIFSPEISGKILISILLLTLSSSLIYFFKYFEKIKGFSVLLVIILTFNNSFFKGNIDFLFGLSFLFIGLGFLLRKNFTFNNSDIIFLIFLSVIIFLSHGIIYFLWLLFGFLIFILYRNGKKLGYYLSFIPSVFLLIIYVLNNNTSSFPRSNYVFQQTLFNSISFKIHSFLDYFSVIQQFFPTYNSSDHLLVLIGGIVNLLFLFLIISICLLLLKKKFEMKGLDSILFIYAIILLLAFIVGPYYFYGVHNPGQRFLYTSIFILIALATRIFNKVSNKFQNSVKILLIIIFIIQIIFLHFYVNQVSKILKNNFQEIETTLIKYHLQYNFQNVFAPDYNWASTFPEKHEFHEGMFDKFVPYINPLSRLPYYFNIKYHTYASIFPTGIIIYNHKRIPKSIKDFEKMIDKPKAIILFMGNLGKNVYVANILQSEYNIIYRNRYYFVLIKKV